MTVDVPSRRFRRAATLVLALLLTAGIVLLRLADDNETNAVLLLLVVPIGVVAAEFGLAGGVTAAAASLGLFAVWNGVDGDGVGPIGYLTRAVIFFGFAAAIGLPLDRRPRFFEDGPNHRLVNTPGYRSEHSAEVVGFSPGGRVLVRLDDGRAIEVPLLEGMRNRFEVGSLALIYFDDKGILVGWYLPDAGIGQDMRDDR